jgi:hypothetical protein
MSRDWSGVRAVYGAPPRPRSPAYATTEAQRDAEALSLIFFGVSGPHPTVFGTKLIGKALFNLLAPLTGEDEIP